jgi:anti-sigma regulatory factor (Ser/Thr protein kinase)
MDYTAVGDTVNLASRLVDIAGGGQMLVCREVYRRVKGRFPVEFFRTIRVKGKQMPVDIYKLGGEKEGDMKKPPSEVDLTIPMLPEMELAASKTATAVAEFMKLEEDKVEEIRLALIEACLNAIEHSKSKDRKVYINFVIHDDELEITIQDFGEGFDVEEIKEQIAERAPRALLKRGWGLRIMEGLMDHVEVQSSSKGTLIRMIKHR